ncbi:MAG TPA: hypothetical protein VFQ39_01525 [Longimicrobium sp.]|nr:hypothetical protein [Longimicrobium sp.]
MAGTSDFPPGAEVRGGNVLSMLAALGPFRRRGEQVLAEHGIGAVEADGWYPLAPYIEALDAIQRRLGPNTLFQTGREIPNHVVLPPGIDTFEKVLASFGQAFDLNHRGWPAGAITYRVESPRSATIVSGTPYPCDFDRGVIRGFFEKLLDARAAVRHDETADCKLRDRTCTFHVTLPLK